MKKMFLLVAMLFIGITATNAQTRFDSDNDDGTTLFVGFGIDAKMATVGPYHNKENDIGTTFNGEFRLGFLQEWKNSLGMRFMFQHEVHPAIKYNKTTWLDASIVVRDHLLWFPVDNFNQYAGLEIATIRRVDPLYEPGSINHYIENTSTKLNPGVNFEITYQIPDTHFAFGINYNIFRAEQILIDDGKQIRTDAMVSIYITDLENLLNIRI